MQTEQSKYNRSQVGHLNVRNRARRVRDCQTTFFNSSCLRRIALPEESTVALERKGIWSKISGVQYLKDDYRWCGSRDRRRLHTDRLLRSSRAHTHTPTTTTTLRRQLVAANQTSLRKSKGKKTQPETLTLISVPISGLLSYCGCPG